jgi:PAS domain S-box-containing protein
MSSLRPLHATPAHAQRLLAVSTELLGAWGFDGHPRLLNPAWSRALGHSEDDLLATPYLDLVHPDDRAQTEAVVAGLAGGGHTEEFVCRLRRADGEYRSLLFTGEGRPEDGCVYVSATDITDRLRVERELGERADRLERINAELQEFTYIASHDLAEPLRMITSYLDLLQRRYGGQLDDTADEFIGFAVDGAERMKALIDDLLAYSRVGSDELQLALGPAIEEAGATVTVAETLPTVRGDRTQLGQLVQNLVANAVKFRAEGRPPSVVVSAVAESGHVRLSVADNGIGIPETQRDRIFAMFARLHGRGAYEGTGIGLALCRRIAGRHGGRLSVESEPGQGSTFSVWIPAA